MIPSKILTLCLVGFVLLANFIDARPAPDESDGKDKLKHVVHRVHKEGEHVHRVGGGSGVHHFKVGGGGGSGGGGGGGGTHVHHIEEGGGGGGGGGSGGTHVHHIEEGGGGGGEGGSGGTHVHHIEEGGGGGGGGGSGGTHVHHFSTGGSGGGGAGGAGGGGAGGGGAGGGGAGDIGGDLNLSGGGSGGSGGNLNIDADGSGLGGLNIKGFSPDTIKKFKKLLSDNNIDLSKLDLGNLNLGGGGGGAAGGAAAGGAAGGGGIHKFDGKDSLQPAMCDDSINDRYGVGKHFVRGTRDVGFAIVSEAEAILDPLLGFITHGVGQGLKALLCAIEDGFSDFGSDFDSATDIAKHGLVNFFKLQGPHPVLGIPIGIGGIAGEAVKAAVSIAGDAVGGVANAVNEVITNLG
ncbi:unnamed protein product [Larinioides sclopetarius]|uniref:Uncharacterized protein n=1 Tax=Larinioides sclopetarius TaxID=280406 RepID=A0AAV1ZXC4_9ARAC